MKTRLLTLFCMVVATLLFQTAVPAGAAAQAADRLYVGSETCMACHEDYYDSYMKNRHGIAADPRTPEAQMGCESCHGPGSEHVDADGEGGIRSLKADSADGATINNAACLQCHAKGGQALWHGSEHEGRDLSCTSCHSTHKNLRQKSRLPKPGGNLPAMPFGYPGPVAAPVPPSHPGRENEMLGLPQRPRDSCRQAGRRPIRQLQVL